MIVIVHVPNKQLKGKLHMTKSKALLTGDKCLVMQPELIKAVGKSAALLLQQIHYWIENPKITGKFYQEKKWIANSYECWSTDLKIISSSTIKRAVKNLKDLGILLVEKLSSFKSNRTNWYTINYERIAEIIHTHDISLPANEATSDQDTFDLNRANLTSSSDQNDPMYIDKKTKKEILINQLNSNKSKDGAAKKETFKKPIAQQLLDTWNEIINPEIHCELTKNRARFLIAAFKHKFHNDFQKWKEYCINLTSSDYLMGKLRIGYKIVLDTAIKFDFIQRVFEKQFGIKGQEKCLVTDNAILIEIDNSSSPENVKEIKREIFKAVGKEIFISWFKDTPIKLSSTSIEIEAPNAFKRDWISRNYSNILQNLMGERYRVFIIS